MSATAWSWRVLAAAGLAAAFCLAGAAWADDKDKGKDDKKPMVIMLDLNKLPPDVAKRLLEIASGEGKKGEMKEEKKEEKKGPPKTPPGLARKGEPKPEDKKKDDKKAAGKTISLTKAIAIAEKSGKGQAVKAERKGEGAELHFKVEVVGKDGTKTKIQLSATGAVQEGEKEEPKGKGPPATPGRGLGKKPEKKKDKDDDD